MKILFLFAIVAASLSVTAVAHAECPLLMQKRMLLSDKAQLPSNTVHSSDSAVSSQSIQNGKVKVGH
jgi:hypothetical protein